MLALGTRLPYSVERARQYLNLPQEAFIVTAFGKFRNREEIRMVASAFCKWNEKNKLLLAPRLYPFSRRNEYGWNLFKRWASRLGYYLAMPLLNRLLKFHAGANDELIDNCDLPYYIAASDVIFIQRKDILNSGNVPLGFLFHKVVVGPTTGNIGEILSATGNPTFHPDDRSDILEALEKARQLSAWGHEKGAFANRLNFETYNLGHLMMAGIIHRRATGKITLFDAAVKATDFLCHFYETASAELARNAICPSHYMGVVEMYRATGNPRYLELSKNLIDIRGMVENGTDDNQDRIPFRDQYRAMGHAVRANYLYAGVADVYAETGEQQLMKNLTSIWNDIVTRKMYVTGACGALYDGTSPDGTCYEPDSIQKVHQSYGRPYQLPNSTAHNETCANIGNMLFNWRMLEVTGDAKYADLVETCLYNSVLSGISLDGKKYFYTNPLRISADLPYTLRWPKERTEYISCFCCPPNTLRTLCQAQNYAYTLSPEGIYCNLYGANTLTTTWKDKGELALTQETDYPWEGKVCVTLDRVPRKAGAFSLFLRIPEWCEKTTLTVNGQPLQTNTKANSYAEVNRTWKKGDVVELVMDMPVRLLEAHPLAEEIRNQVVVKRGPLVYCLESMDIANGEKIDNVLIPADIKLTPKKITIEGSPIVALEGMARLASATSWEGVLYRPVVQAEKTVNIRLIPYYAWGNRGKGEMTVWMPLAR